ncbi:MAG: family 16 glycosylhydrolase [Polaribacter sp.]|uniref:family 16 glycosylhydrolase n=1 Tax=Polaribacter sp. TaxID=1920175 RepID=UPI003BB1D41B
MKNLLLIYCLLVSYTFYSQVKVEDDFEGNGTISSWFGDGTSINTNFSNPFKNDSNNSNTVLKYDDGGAQYANLRFDINKKFDLSENYTFSLKIYVPSNSITGSQTNKISFKLQDNSNPNGLAPWQTQAEIIKTIVLNQWQTITFNYKDDTIIYQNIGTNATQRTDFNRVLIQVNGEDNNDKVIAYLDDFLYDGTIEESNDPEDPVFDNLVWSDEFDGNGEIDKDKWFQQTRPIINGVDWANGEIQHYTDRTDNSYVSNGTLKILAKKEAYTSYAVLKNYTSARLNSKYAFTYGKVEIRAKMPIGVGTFPALWMLGQNITENGGYWAATHGTTGWPDCGEIDIIEHWGDNQDFVQSALHNRSSFGGTINKGGRTISNASSTFHIYTLDWNSTKMTFSVDGIVHYVYNPSNKNIQNWPYFAPQYLLFNVAILPNITSSFTESAMEIDYVRVYQQSRNLSVNDESIDTNSIYAYPNPVIDNLTIKGNIDSNSNLTLYDITGKKIHIFKQNSNVKNHDISFLKKGIYFLKIATQNTHKTLKIIKG